MPLELDFVDVDDMEWADTPYAEELPPEMNTVTPAPTAGYTHGRAGGVAEPPPDPSHMDPDWGFKIDGGDHIHDSWRGISSGSGSSSSTGSSSHAQARSDPFSTISWNKRHIEDLSYLLKLIIELYDLDEIKPLYEKMEIDFLAHKSMYRHRYIKEPELKKTENIFDDELFKI